MSITVEATKSWSGDQKASTQVFSVPKGPWEGKAKIISIDPRFGSRAWARVLDGRSADFWSGPANFGDHQTMSAFTDLVVVQFFAVGDEQGTARGTFTRSDVKLPKKPLITFPPLRIPPKNPWFVGGLLEVTAVPGYRVLEGAEPLSKTELDRVLEHLSA